MTETKCGLSRKEMERLADIIMVLQRCFMMHLSEGLGHGQVSFPQFFLLWHITAEASPLSMSEIAERMNHRTAATTGLVDRLENLGYVRRVHDANDRRRVVVQITPKGRDLVEGMRQEMLEGLTCLSSVLTHGEQKSWLAIYEKIHQHITCSAE